MPDLIQVQSPNGVKFTVAREAADAFTGLLADLEGQGYKVDQGQSGGYNPRNIAGTNTPSLHSFGHAIDINSTWNPRGANADSDMPPNIGDLAAKRGLVWGGTWSGDSRDPMHFEFRPGGAKTVAAQPSATWDSLGVRPSAQPPASAPAATPASEGPADTEAQPSATWDSLGAPRSRVETKPAPSGKVANIGAGLIEGSQGGLNWLTDPIGNLLHQGAIAGGTAYDAGARATGLWAPMTPGQRRTLYDDDSDTQTGTRLGNAIGAIMPGTGGPQDVQANTTAERLLRAGSAGLAGGVVLPNALLGPLAGAVGAITGEEGARLAPEWAQPGAQLVGNLLGGGVVLGGVPRAYNALGRLSEGGIELPPGVSPLSPQAAAIYDAQQTARGPVDPMRARVLEARRAGEGGPPEGPPGGGGAPGEGPSPGMGPRSAGAAATPAEQAALTEQQAREYGSTADKQWLYKSFTPGEAITDEFIPGIKPTMAQREQSVVSARETKAARNLSPEAAQAEQELLADHNTKRKDFFQQTAGSDVTQGIAIREANAAIDSQLEAAFRSGKQADPAPIVEAISAERASPGGKLPPVRSVLNSIEEAMQKADGTGLETDPRQLWGVRRVINYLQSKYGIAENPAIGHPDVQAALGRIKDVLDTANENVAPGFTEALKNYSEAQRRIEANEVMQDAEKKLYDDKGRMQFSRFHKFMSDAIQSRDPRAGINGYQSLSPEQMARLKSLHDDLMRVASADDLARSRGSDTLPNFLDTVAQAAKGATGTVVAGTIGHVVGGVPGAVLGGVAQSRIANLFDKRAIRRANEDMNRLLNPDPAKYPTRPNPFLTPPEAP